MFNPHIHQQQQQQQFHQHLRQLQQLFQQQPPPPPPPPPPQPAPGHHVAHHHHPTPRAIPVPPQTAPPARMVNLCQATQTTIIAPNPMLQGALLMQQMQGNMRGFAMGGQQFRQFFAAQTRSSLLGPVPMGVGMKSPMMGFPAAMPFHPHVRYYNNTTNTTTAPSSSSSSTSTTNIAAHQPDRKRDSEQMATESTDDQPAANTSTEASDKAETDNAVGGDQGSTKPSEEAREEPAVKKPRTQGPDEPKDLSAVETETVPVEETDAEADPFPVLMADGEILSSESDSQPGDCILLEEGGSAAGSDVAESNLLEGSITAEVHSCLPATLLASGPSEEDQQVNLPPAETPHRKDACLTSAENQEEPEEGVAEGSSKFYCYLCSITCHNQQNFRSHMNSVSHQQRMMEIQHMSNACLVTLLPRVQESLQGASKDGPVVREKNADPKRWCATCQSHFSSTLMDHRRTKQHKLASRSAISSCTVCKKHFRTSQIFVEHLQSQEHRQKVDKLQESECCADADKLSVVDAEGFLVEEEGSEVDEEEERRLCDATDRDDSDKQDGWTPLKEVALKDIDADEQYDPDTVYGSSFFVPVAGFICRLCKEFYHFESSSLHSHCKTLKHFENLKNYKTLMSQKGEARESGTESVQAQDRLAAGTSKDGADENSFSGDAGSVSELNTKQLTQLTQQTEEQAELGPSAEAAAAAALSPGSAQSADHELGGADHELGGADHELGGADHELGGADHELGGADHELHSPEEEHASQAPLDQENQGNQEPGPDPTPADEGNDEEEGEAMEVQGKRNSAQKAKPAQKRRSGRAANRR